MTSKILPTAKRLRELFHFDPETGIFIRLVRAARSTKIGDVAGWLTEKGYRRIGIDGRFYRAHHLAWLWAHGVWPVDELDHINGQRDDNRIGNLRESNRSGNNQNLRKAQKNNKSGFLGVSFCTRTSKWYSAITVNGARYYLGHHLTPELAHEAYLEAKRELHPACTI
jgi:hypothetical protein